MAGWAETKEEAEGWVDALLLLAHLAAQACLPALRWALAPRATAT